MHHGVDHLALLLALLVNGHGHLLEACHRATHGVHLLVKVKLGIDADLHLVRRAGVRSGVESIPTQRSGRLLKSRAGCEVLGAAVVLHN